MPTPFQGRPNPVAAIFEAFGPEIIPCPERLESAPPLERISIAIA